MTDIVERLRLLAREFHQHRTHYEEAVAEIERLRAENADIQRIAVRFEGEAERLRTEIERLRAELQKIDCP